MGYFNRAILFTLKWEDSHYKDMPLGKDEGDGAGLTRLGITEKYDSQYFPDGKGIDDLTFEDILNIYKTQYWNSMYDTIGSYKLAARLFDFGVNKGKVSAIKALQAAVNDLITTPIEVDGKFGPCTLQAINECLELHGNDLYNIFIKKCEAIYRAIVDKNPAKQRFLRGWLNRLFDDIEAV